MDLQHLGKRVLVAMSPTVAEVAINAGRQCSITRDPCNPDGASIVLTLSELELADRQLDIAGLVDRAYAAWNPCGVGMC